MGDVSDISPDLNNIFNTDVITCLIRHFGVVWLMTLSRNQMSTLCLVTLLCIYLLWEWGWMQIKGIVFNLNKIIGPLLI